MSESWNIGRVDLETGSGIHPVRCCEPKGLLKAAPRSGGRFPPCLGLTVGRLAVSFNAEYRRCRGTCGTGPSCKPPSRGSRSRSILWLLTTLLIGLVASLCCPACVACDVSKDKLPATTSDSPRLRVVPARLSELITATGCASSNALRHARATPAPPSIVQPPLTELSAEVEPLREDFNRSASSIRLLLILSPS
jgi:hypothetical protein